MIGTISTKVSSIFLPNKTSLYTPFMDVFLAGGAAIAFFVVFYFFVDTNASLVHFAWATYFISFLVNYPHFIASYQILYGDSKSSFFDTKSNTPYLYRLWFAGLIVPVVLFGFFYYALSSGSTLGTPIYMGYLVSAMFFFVGWHYIKQIYGCVIVLSSAKQVYYSALERRAILAPLYLLWILSFVAANINGATAAFYDIGYQTMQVPQLYVTLSYILLTIATLFLVLVLIRKYKKTGTYPPLGALAALGAIYIWYIPAITHPLYFYIIPFFHSLQYLLFVLAYRRNKAIAETGRLQVSETSASSSSSSSSSSSVFAQLSLYGMGVFVLIPFLLLALFTYMNPSAFTSVEVYIATALSTPAISSEFLITVLVVFIVLASVVLLARLSARKSAFGKFSLFFVNAYVLGFLFFAVVPSSLDALALRQALPGVLSYDSAIFKGSLYLFFFTVFINIHHYFIDNVIWKKENPHIRKYLFNNSTEIPAGTKIAQ